jgi:dephospho-CoA kinase
LVIGLTGGIASGKSTVAEMFAKLGVPVIDADAIARELVTPRQAALREIGETFGTNYINEDGTLNRSRLRALIFADPSARKRLEAILHPRVYAEIRERLKRITAPYGVVAVPLLVETADFGLFDRILVIDSPEMLQQQRLMARDGISAEQAAQALNAQASRAQRLAVATEIIANDKSIAELESEVARLHATYTAASA